MTAYARQRSVEFLAASLAVVAPEHAGKSIKELRSLLFPEERFDDILYLKKAKEAFEKMKKLDLRIRK